MHCSARTRTRTILAAATDEALRGASGGPAQQIADELRYMRSDISEIRVDSPDWVRITVIPQQPACWDWWIRWIKASTISLSPSGTRLAVGRRMVGTTRVQILMEGIGSGDTRALREVAR